MGLARVASAVEQVTPTPDGGFFVRCCGFSRPARVGLRTSVSDSLCNSVLAGSLVKVANAIQQGQFDACYLRKASFAFHRVQPFGTLGPRERGWNLVDELQPMRTNLKSSELRRGNQLKDHCCLVRGPAKCLATEQ
jgi:hypothetical protein